eukprot:scaffold48791_cov59-Phaeocystis_antarctica.AAC.2
MRPYMGQTNDTAQFDRIAEGERSGRVKGHGRVGYGLGNHSRRPTDRDRQRNTRPKPGCVCGWQHRSCPVGHQSGESRNYFPR